MLATNRTRRLVLKGKRHRATRNEAGTLFFTHERLDFFQYTFWRVLLMSLALSWCVWATLVAADAFGLHHPVPGRPKLPRRRKKVHWRKPAPGCPTRLAVASPANDEQQTGQTNLSPGRQRLRTIAHTHSKHAVRLPLQLRKAEAPIAALPQTPVTATEAYNKAHIRKPESFQRQRAVSFRRMRSGTTIARAQPARSPAAKVQTTRAPVDSPGFCDTPNRSDIDLKNRGSNVET